MIVAARVLLLLLLVLSPAQAQMPLLGAGSSAGAGKAPAISLNFATGVYAPTGVATNLSITNTSGGTAQNADGSVVSFAANTLRISTQGLLIEAGTTNLSLQTSDFTNAAWSLTNATATTGATAPDGTTKGATFADNSTSGAHYILATTAVAFTSGSNYTASIFAKTGTTNLIQLTFSGSGAFSGNGSANFDLTAGTVTSTAGTLAGSGIVKWSNGWCRIWITATATGTASVAGLAVVAINSSTAARVPTYVGTGTNVLIWGAQTAIEPGSTPTSYFPTTTAAATRAADNITIQGNLLTLIEGSAGRLEFFPQNILAHSNTYLGVNASTSALGTNSTLHLTSAWNAAITSPDVLSGSNPSVWYATYTTVLSWNSRGVGITASTTTPQASPSTVTTPTSACLGSLCSNATYLNGYLSQLLGWNIDTSQPPVAAVMFYDRKTFFDDFTSTSTIDLTDSGAAGFNWYLRMAWPYGSQRGWYTTASVSSSAVSISSSIITLSNASAYGATIVSAVQNGAGAYNGFAASGGAYLEASMAYNPANAASGQTSWPAFWSRGINSLINLNNGTFTELDFFEAVPSGTGTTSTVMSIHDWIGTSNGDGTFGYSTNNANTNNSMSVSSPTSQNRYATLWVTATNNGGTGLFVRYLNDGQLTTNKVTYSSGAPATPGASPSNPNGTFYDIDSDGLLVMLAGGAPSGAFNAQFDFVGVWQP